MAEAFCCRGNTLAALMRLDAALANYDQAIAIRPGYAEAFNDRGDTLRRQRRFDEALASCEQAIVLNPNHPDALGESSASFDEAIALKPDEPRAFYNLGILLGQLGAHDAALASYDKAIARKPDYADAFHNRGIALAGLMRSEEARASYVRILGLAPDHDYAFSDWADCELKLCDWTRRDQRSAELREHVTARKSCINPFTLLGYSDDEALQSLCARNFIRERTVDRPPRVAAAAIRRNARIRVAYISADFRRHAIARLSAGLYEQHDRSRFDVIGMSLGPNDGSEVRARLAAPFDPFVDVATKNDEEAARLLRDLAVDIAVDLNGHTKGRRLGILAARPAPIQVTWLGFPGTTGADFIDYIIADATVLPFAQQAYYTEHIVHLPDTYQTNDRRRPIAPRTPTRQELGLPPGGLVFCCFNNTWKITPRAFDVWMRLLRAIEGSTLWLLEAGERPEANLCKEAAARGVDSARVVFAGRSSGPPPRGRSFPRHVALQCPHHSERCALVGPAGGDLPRQVICRPGGGDPVQCRQASRSHRRQPCRI
jgi:protein O-GlcNAc transferase